MKLEKLCPILPSGDIGRSEAFYRQIGFATVYREEDYLLMKRDMAEVHFFLKTGHRPETCEHGAYLRPNDIDSFSAEVERLGLPDRDAFPKFTSAEDKPWGMREAALWDPDGNLIRAGQELPNG